MSTKMANKKDVSFLARLYLNRNQLLEVYAYKNRLNDGEIQRHEVLKQTMNW